MNSWWVLDVVNHRRGPITPGQISLLVHLESVVDESSVYSEELGSWVPFRSCDALKGAIAGQIGSDEDQPRTERLSMADVPMLESMPCSDASCPNLASGGCDLVYIWDRQEKLWLTFEEYVKVCRESGLLSGLPERLLAGSSAQIQDLLHAADGVGKRSKKQGKPTPELSEDDEPLSDPEKEAKRQKRRAYRERKKLKRDAGLWVKSKVNPNIYVSGLPLDISAADLYSIFHQAGQIKPDLQTNGHRIKVYGNGDALITFMHEESVKLAIERFNEYPVREGYVISVQQADFSIQPEDTPLSLEELREKAELNRDQRLKRMELYKKEKNSRSGWELGTSGLRPVVVFGPVVWDEYIEAEVGKFCAKFGIVRKIKYVGNFFCAKFAKIDLAEACVAAIAETDGLAIPDPADPGTPRITLPGFLHDGRDLTFGSRVEENRPEQPPAWEEFLGQSDTDDEDLVIRTE